MRVGSFKGSGAVPVGAVVPPLPPAEAAVAEPEPVAPLAAPAAVAVIPPDESPKRTAEELCKELADPKSALRAELRQLLETVR